MLRVGGSLDVSLCAVETTGQLPNLTIIKCDQEEDVALFDLSALTRSSFFDVYAPQYQVPKKDADVVGGRWVLWFFIFTAVSQSVGEREVLPWHSQSVGLPTLPSLQCSIPLRPLLERPVHRRPIIQQLPQPPSITVKAMLPIFPARWSEQWQAWPWSWVCRFGFCAGNYGKSTTIVQFINSWPEDPELQQYPKYLNVRSCLPNLRRQKCPRTGRKERWPEIRAALSGHCLPQSVGNTRRSQYALTNHIYAFLCLRVT